MPIYVHFNRQTFSGVLDQFFFTSKFLGLRMLNRRFFLKKIGFEGIFCVIKLTFMLLQTGQSDLKNTKQLKFCLW